MQQSAFEYFLRLVPYRCAAFSSSSAYSEHEIEGGIIGGIWGMEVHEAAGGSVTRHRGAFQILRLLDYRSFPPFCFASFCI